MFAQKQRRRGWKREEKMRRIDRGRTRIKPHLALSCHYSYLSFTSIIRVCPEVAQKTEKESDDETFWKLPISIRIHM